MAKPILEKLTFNIGGKVTREKFEGRWHTVVSATMIRRGVWEGSQGKLFYDDPELSPVTNDWNHMPVVVYHPNGSARKTQVLNRRKIGVVLNTRFKDHGWQTKVYIDEKRADKVDKRILKNVRAGKNLEGSTGIYTVNVRPGGTFEGKKYDAKATQIKPDHFAILPDAPGACSLKDGCGVTVNSKACKCGFTCKSCKTAVRMEYNKKVAKSKVSVARNHLGKLVNNALSFQEISRALSDVLSAEYGEKGRSWYGYVCDVYPDKVVFWGADGKQYVQSYKTTDAGVELTGSATQVVRVSEYRTTDGKAVVNSGQGSKPSEVRMSVKAKKKVLVNRLIKNGRFEEEDRDDLMGTPIKVLRQLKGGGTAVNVNLTQPAPVANKKTKKKSKQTQNGRGDDFNSWMNQNVPAPFRPVLQNMNNHYNQTKAQLIEAILAIPVTNKAMAFTDKFLATKDVPELQGMLALVQAGGGQQVNNEGGGGIQMFQQGPYLGAAGGMTVNQGPTNNQLPEPLEDREIDWKTKEYKKTA